MLLLSLSSLLVAKSSLAFTPSRGTESFSIRKSDAPSPGVKTVNIGKDMDLSFLAPSDEINRQLSSRQSAGSTITTTNGDGDVVWPSSVALARLIAHCPFMVNDKRILELGCGLGLPSLAALLHASPSHVALSDRDSQVLSLAYKSSTQLNRTRASVSRATIEWTDDSTWPKQDFDLVMGSDLLYERQSVPHLVRVLTNFLLDEGATGKQAIIVDPVGRRNRDVFMYAAFKAGLEVEEEPFPGMDNFVLLTISS